MANGYLEKHQQDYEARKAAFLRKKKHLPPLKRSIAIRRTDDEAL